MRVIREGQRPGRRRDRQDQDRPRRADGGRHRRAALPARPGPAASCASPCRSPRSAPAGRARSATCWPLPTVTAPSAPRPGADRARPGPVSGSCASPRSSRKSEQVSSIYLAAVDGAALPAARAGQYLTLRITGAGQPAPVRSYSLSSAPDTRHLPDQRQARAARHRQQLPEPRPATGSRSWTWLRPRGDFVLDDGTGPVLLISAGIGVTPVLSMLHQLAARHSERDIWWLHGARGPQGTSLRGRGTRPAGLAAARPRARVLQRGHTRRAPAAPTPLRGRLTKETLAGLGIPAGASAYVCGPAVVHGRHAGRPDRDRPRPGAHPHRAVRGPAA